MNEMFYSDPVGMEKKKMKQDILVTEAKKNKFIDEIKSGLGEKIMEEPNKVQKKLNFWQKMVKLFKQ